LSQERRKFPQQDRVGGIFRGRYSVRAPPEGEYPLTPSRSIRRGARIWHPALGLLADHAGVGAVFDASMLASWGAAVTAAVRPSRLCRAAAGRSRARKHGNEVRGEDAMPHVIVKLWPGKSEQQKKKLAEEVNKAVMSTLNYGEESVSVGIEEAKSQDSIDQVYKPDILGKRETMYKEPGYEP
jgi:4-oxalocrotonate tautomerase